MTSFFTELRKRRVFRVGAAYALVGWFLIQAADVIVEPLGLPDWVAPLLIVSVFLGFPVAILLAWAFDLTPDGVERAPLLRPGSFPPSDTSEGTVAAEPDVERSVAVLPFANLSRDESNEYFSDGITDDLITHLSKIADLRVISRTSVMRFKDRTASAEEIGGELGVSRILEGSVRREGKRVRVNAQLVDVRTDDHLWAESYDRELEDIFAIQLDVATRIANSLQAHLSGEEQSGLARRPTENMEAYDLYLKGRFHWNRRSEADLKKSVRYLLEAVDRDPQYALALAGLADSYVTLGVYGAQAPGEVMPLARSAAERSLAIEESAAARVSRASVLGLHDWDWTSAEADYRAAIELNPGYAQAHQWYATNLLLPLGRFEEGRQRLIRARDLDPLSPAIRASFGILDFYERRYEEAIDGQQRVLETDPHFGLAHYVIGSCHEQLGRHDEAIEAYRKASDASGGSVETLAALGSGLALAGHEGEARDLLEQLRDRARDSYVSPVRLAQLLLGLGEREKALAALSEAGDSRATELIWLRVHPAWDHIRADQRFEALVDIVFGARPA